MTDLVADRAIEQERSVRSWLGPFADALRPSRGVLAAIGVFVLFIYVGQSVANPVPDHGNWWTDMQQSMAFRRMATHGIWQARLALPMDDGITLGTEPFLYANWPTGQYTLYALLSRAGFSLIQIRIVPLLVTALAAYLLFAFVRCVAGRRVAWWTMLLFLTAAPVRLLSDAIGLIPYDMAFRFATFLFTAVTASIDRNAAPRAWWAGVAATALVLGSYSSLFGFEAFPAMCIFAFAFPLAMAWLRLVGARQAIQQATIATATGVVAGVLVRLWFLAILPGPLGDDLRSLSDSAEKYRFGPNDLQRDFLHEWAYRLWALVPVLVVLAIVAGVLAIARLLGSKRLWRPAVVGAAVLIAECAWIVVVRSHSQRHVHTIELLMGSLALAGGWVVAEAERLAASLRVHVAFLLLAAVGLGVILTDPGVRPYWNVSDDLDWTYTQQQAHEVRDGLPGDVVLALTPTFRAGGPAFWFFAERPIIFLPNDDFGELVQRRPVALMRQKGVDDPAVAAAIVAGASVEFETASYQVLRVDPSLALPPELDPDG